MVGSSSVERGVIRQFVAMPLGKGYSVEEQSTGTARHGGIQILVCPMKREKYEALFALFSDRVCEETVHCLQSAAPMGLAPGGRMRQAIYDDPHGLRVRD